MTLSEHIPELVAGSVIGAPAFWLFIQKVFLKTAQIESTHYAVNAESEVIALLRGEVERMAEGNKVLHEQLQKFHEENVHLRKEITILQTTISELSARLNILTLSRPSCVTCPLDRRLVGR